MNKEQLFESALSISNPFFIEKIDFDNNIKRIDIYINFSRGSTFQSVFDGNEYTAHDTKQKIWRHLNFFEHECYLHCRTPRIKNESGGIELISPPWAGKCPGLTLLFESFILELSSHMPVKCVSKITNVNDDKIWRLLDKYIDIARSKEDFSEINSIGMDETSRAKHHQYITLFVDLNKNRTIFVAEGKGHETVKQFVNDLEVHKGQASKILDVSCDMSPAFINPTFAVCF